jgi:hypothetical protein
LFTLWCRVSARRGRGVSGFTGRDAPDDQSDDYQAQQTLLV